MHTSELLSTLFLAYEDLRQISQNLSFAAAELDRRGEKEAKRLERNHRSFTPLEFLQADHLAWSADQLDVIAQQIESIHKQVEDSIKF